jgi:hypothetical protein
LPEPAVPLIGAAMVGPPGFEPGTF